MTTEMKKIFLKIKGFLRVILFVLMDAELTLFHKRKERMNKVLIIRIDAIGDFILFSPFISFYKELYPKHRVTLLVDERNEPLAKKFARDIILFDRKRFYNDLAYRRQLVKKIHGEAFDIAIYPTYSREPYGDYLVKITGAREKIGFSSTNTLVLKHNKDYTRLLNAPDEKIPELEKNENFLKQLGLQPPSLIPCVPVTKQEKQYAAKLLQDSGLSIDTKFVVLNPGASASYRIWSLERYADLATWLHKKGLMVVITGSPQERVLAEKIKHMSSAPIIDLPGKTDLNTLGAILQQSVLYVGSETGTLHVAAAAGTPTICIMGGGHFKRFFPYGDLIKNRVAFDPHMNCMNDNWACGKNLKQGEPAPCIKDITTKQVTQEASDILHLPDIL